MNIRTTLILPAAAAALLSLAACEKAIRSTGFIPTTVKMKTDDELTHSWRSPRLNLADYGKVTILAVETPEQGAYGNLTAEQLENCRRILSERLKEAFAKAPGTGDRTLVIHAAITAIKPNQPMRNIAPQTQILKRGYGYAACEIFASDGELGPVLAAFMQTSDTTRFSTEKLSETGTAERAAGDWATAFRKVVGY